MVQELSPKRRMLNVARLSDLLLTAMAFACSYLIKKYLLPEQISGLKPDVNYTLILFLILVIWYFVFEYFEVRFIIDRTHFFKNIVSLIIPILTSFLLLLMALFLFKVQNVSRILMSLFVALDFSFLSLIRWFTFTRLSDKYPLHSILIIVIGSKIAAKEMLDKILEKGRGIEIIGCLELEEEEVGKVVTDDIRVIGTIQQLEKILREKVIDEIVFVIPIEKIIEGEKYLAIAQSVGVKIRIIPHWHLRKFIAQRPKFYSMYYEIFGDVPSLIFSPAPQKRGAIIIKTVSDFIIASVLLILSMPLFAVIAILIKLKSPGPIFFRQERCGLFGRRFILYKFRTMVPGAEKLQECLKEKNISDGPTFKVKDDPRVIPGIGKFLRSTGLDELPQLLNVIKGEMSLIGPRPPVPEEVEKYDLWQRRRLSMKPGITCTWQITPNRNLVTFKEWMEMDLDYIDNWSLWLDLKIALKTVIAAFKRYGM